MNEVFKITLSLSCSGALLVIIFRLFRPLIRARLSRQWQYYIWLVVVARLLIPIAPQINLMGMLFEQIGHRISQVELAIPAVQNESFGQNGGTVQSGVPANHPRDEAVRGGHPAAAGSTNRVRAEHGTMSVLLQYIWLFWLITALVLFIRKITIYQSFVKYIRAGCVEAEEIEVLERFGGLVGQSGVKTAVELSINPLISSPLLTGFFRPRIVLPTTNLSDSDFQFTILHELTHFKRLDMFYKWLMQAVICIHWFNPFVHLLGGEVERACELACDEAVICKLDAQGRRAYGDTLMNAIAAGGHYKDSVAAVTLCESTELLRERLGAITGFHQQSRFARAGSIVLAVAVCLSAVSVGAYSAPMPGTKPRTSGDLTLVTAEYTVKELIKADVKTISVQTLSDEITVVRGGDTVKFEYYAESPEEYSLELMNNPLFLSRTQRNTPPLAGERSITITVPEESPIEELYLCNTTGNIYLDDCAFSSVSIATQTGAVEMAGVTVDRILRLRTESGDALLSGTVLPVRDEGYSTFETRTGFITFQPVDDPYDYRIEIDYGDEANMMINQEYVEKSGFLEEYAVTNSDGSTSYPPEGAMRINQFTINENGASVIYFTSPKGTLRMLGK